MSTRIAFTLGDTRIRSEVRVSLSGSREEWRVLKNGYVLASCPTEGTARRVKAELDELAKRILSGELDDPPNPLQSKCLTHDNRPGCECCGNELDEEAKRIHEQALCGDCVFCHNRGDFDCDCVLQVSNEEENA